MTHAWTNLRVAANPHYPLILLMLLFAICNFTITTTFRNSAYNSPCFNFEHGGKTTDVDKSDTSRAMVAWDLPMWLTQPDKVTKGNRVFADQIRINAAVSNGGVRWWPEQLTRTFAGFASQAKAMERNSFDLDTAIKEETIIDQWESRSQALITCFPNGGGDTTGLSASVANDRKKYQKTKRGQNVHFNDVCGYRAFQDFSADELGYELEEDTVNKKWFFKNQPSWTFEQKTGETGSSTAKARATEVQLFLEHSCKRDLTILFSDSNPDSTSSKAVSTTWPLERSFGVLFLFTSCVLFLYMLSFGIMKMTTTQKLDKNSNLTKVFIVVVALAMAAILGLLIWTELELRLHYSQLKAVGVTGKNDGVGYAAHLETFTAATLVEEQKDAKKTYKLFRDLTKKSKWLNAGPVPDDEYSRAYTSGELGGTCLQAILFPHEKLSDSWINDAISLKRFECEATTETHVDVTVDSKVEDAKTWTECTPATKIRQEVGDGVTPAAMLADTTLNELDQFTRANAEANLKTLFPMDNGFNKQEGGEAFEFCPGTTQRNPDDTFKHQTPSLGLTQFGGNGGFKMTPHKLNVRAAGSSVEKSCDDEFCVDYGWKYWTTDRPQLYESFVSAGLGIMLLYLVWIGFLLFSAERAESETSSLFNLMM